MNIKTLLDNAKKNLQKNSSSPTLDAEILLSTALKVNRSVLYAYPEKELTHLQTQKFMRLLKRRLQGEPIAYIVKKQEFWSLELKVNKKVLIPRPETELLVELALKKITTDNATVADLGTGSGAIACALAKERPHWKIIATDISKGALRIARLNAATHNIKNIKFCYGSWYNALPKHQKFDAIIANPPYIAPNDTHLTQSNIKFEPSSALISNNNGLEDLFTIITNASTWLKAKGMVILEHGFDQAVSIRKFLQQKNFANIKTYKDLANKDRMTLGYKI